MPPAPIAPRAAARTAVRAAARIAAVAVVLSVPLVLPAAQPASAITYTLEYGLVTRISDGDTIYVDIPGDGKPSHPVRNAMIQATEMHGEDGTPECHAPEATALMARLLPLRTKVRLASRYPSSTSGTDPAGVPRLLRYVEAYNPATGAYDIDVQLAMLQAGLAVWKPEPVETARQVSYHLPMQQAMAARRGIFDTNACGEGPLQGTPMPMWFHYDADGDDAVMNAEWIHLQNRASYDVPLAGWRIRDGGQSFYRGTTYFTFPAGAVLPAGKTLTLYPGSGTNNLRTNKYYLGGSGGTVFPNVTDPRLGYPGKAVYLLDPDLDFRGWADYPCLTGCAKPPVRISNVRYTTAEEYVDVKIAPGVSTPVDLTGVEVTNEGWTHEITPGTILRPGETLRVHCEREGEDTRLSQHWRHRPGTMLEDTGDTVVLRTAQSTVLSTYRWGTG